MRAYARGSQVYHKRSIELRGFNSLFARRCDRGLCLLGDVGGALLRRHDWVVGGTGIYRGREWKVGDRDVVRESSGKKVVVIEMTPSLPVAPLGRYPDVISSAAAAMQDPRELLDQLMGVNRNKDKVPRRRGGEGRPLSGWGLAPFARVGRRARRPTPRAPHCRRRQIRL